MPQFKTQKFKKYTRENKHRPSPRTNLKKFDWTIEEEEIFTKWIAEKKKELAWKCFYTHFNQTVVFSFGLKCQICTILEPTSTKFWQTENVKTGQVETVVIDGMAHNRTKEALKAKFYQMKKRSEQDKRKNLDGDINVPKKVQVNIKFGRKKM